MNKRWTGLTTIAMAMSLSLLVGCGAGSSDDGKQEGSGENTAQAGLLTTDAGVVLEEVGSFSGDGFSIIDNSIYQDTENGRMFYDYLGRPLGEQYFDVSDYNTASAYQDYYILNGTDTERPLVNMITAEGEKLFEEDIEGMISRINDVYAAVLFATGTTDNMEEALFYTTGNNMAIIEGPSAEDTFYTGYVQLYNLEKREFIADLTLPSPYMAAVGDSVLIRLEDGNTVLFDREGNIAWDEFDESYGYDGSYFCREAGGQTEICDETMNPLFTLPEGYVLYESNNYSRNFVVVRNNMDVWLYDLEGNPIFEEPFQSYIRGNDNYCLLRREEDGYDFHLFYYPTKFYSEEVYGGIDVTPDILDYAFCHKDGVYAMYDGQEKQPLDGIMSAGNMQSFAFMKQDEGDTMKYHYYVMQDMDFTLSGEYSSELTDGLLPMEGGSNQGYGLYELVSGKQLFDYAYDEFNVCYGYLYAEKDGAYTVYQIQSPFRAE